MTYYYISVKPILEKLFKVTQELSNNKITVHLSQNQFDFYMTNHSVPYKIAPRMNDA